MMESAGVRGCLMQGLFGLALLAGACGPAGEEGPTATSSGATPAAVAASGPPPAADAAFHFVEVAAASGIDFRHVSGDELHKRQIVEAIAGGLAWFDYDGDGDPDLYLVNSGRQLRSTPPPARDATSGALFRNDGGRFTDVTRAAGLLDWRWGMGVAVGDYDNDGDPDLFVTRVGPDALWRNEGNGTFTDVAASAGVADPGPGSGAAFGDIDADGWLDLYVAHYVEVRPDEPLPSNDELCTYQGVSVFCGPKGLVAAPDRLYRNRGDGTFTDVGVASGIASVSPRFSFDVLFSDLDVDGDQDIYVAADNGPSLLFVNDGTGRFDERGLVAGVALSEAGTAQAGMGVDIADYDGDGWPDIVKTNFESEPFNLYRNMGTGLFSDRAYHAGLAVTVRPLGFGTQFFDADRDGRLDLFFANGHLYPTIESGAAQGEYRQLNLLLRGVEVQGQARFEDVGARAGPGLAVRKSSRGLASADYDGDGDLDLAVQNIDESPDLLRNDSPARGGWFAVRTEGRRSNRDGYGARVTLTAGGRRQVREVRASRSYLSSSDPAVFFGLGSATTIEQLEVAWPSGHREKFEPGAINRLLRVREGEGRLPAS